MAKALPSRRSLIEGRAALIVIDIQASTFIDHSDMRAIDNMAGYTQRMELSRKAIDTARAHDIPVVFIQEVHRPDLIDFGRELDGDEDVHCLEGDPGTEIAANEMGVFANRLSHQETTLFGVLRYRFRNTVARTEGGHAFAVRWIDRCLCALHICRWSSVGLFLPGD